MGMTLATVGVVAGGSCRWTRQEHFADLQEVCVVDAPAFGHSRLRLPALV